MVHLLLSSTSKRRPRANVTIPGLSNDLFYAPRKSRKSEAEMRAWQDLDGSQ